MVARLYAWTLKVSRSGERVLANACLEATLVHLRLLFEFVAGRPSESGRRWDERDATPRQFVPTWPGTGQFDGYLERIDRYIAHISLERTYASAPKSWALERMLDAALLGFDHFVIAVEEAGRPQGTRLRKALNDARTMKVTPPKWPRPQATVFGGGLGLVTGLAAATGPVTVR